jgi:hypothetical protein
MIPTEDVAALAEYLDQLMGPESGARMRDTLNLIKEFNRAPQSIPPASGRKTANSSAASAHGTVIVFFAAAFLALLHLVFMIRCFLV